MPRAARAPLALPDAFLARRDHACAKLGDAGLDADSEALFGALGHRALDRQGLASFGDTPPRLAFAARLAIMAARRRALTSMWVRASSASAMMRSLMYAHTRHGISPPS
jgi:hypothetical protein